MQSIIDIAGSYQAGINLAAVKSEGHSGVVCKATEGTGYLAPLFEEWTAQTRQLGLIPGAYHYLRAGDGAAQAEFFHRRVKAAGGPVGWIVQLDNEADASWQTTVAWAQRWAQLTGGYPFAMYTGDWWWTAPGRGWPGHVLTPYLWAAPNDGYLSSLPAADSHHWDAGYGGWPVLSIAQYTSRGHAGGIRSNVDINAIRDPAVIAVLTGGVGPKPGPPPPPPPPPPPSPSTGGPDMTPQEWKDTQLYGVDQGQPVRVADAMGRIYNWARGAGDAAAVASASAAGARDAAGAAQRSADVAATAAQQALAGVQAMGGQLAAILDAIGKLPAPGGGEGGGGDCPPALVDVKVLVNDQLAAEGKAQVG